jgi:hypothetical protein
MASLTVHALHRDGRALLADVDGLRVNHRLRLNHPIGANNQALVDASIQSAGRPGKLPLY